MKSIVIEWLRRLLDPLVFKHCVNLLIYIRNGESHSEFDLCGPIWMIPVRIDFQCIALEWVFALKNCLVNVDFMPKNVGQLTQIFLF